MARDQRDINGDLTPAGASEWTITNRAVDRSIDCNNNDALINGDAIGNIVADLIAQGIFKGSVS